MFVVHQNGLTVRGAVVAAMLVGLAVGPARAEDAQTNTVVVSSQGLDLRSAEGVAALNSRVEHAAREVCGWQPTDVLADRDYQTCRKAALSGAAGQAQAMIAAAQGKRGTLVAAADPK